MIREYILILHSLKTKTLNQFWLLQFENWFLLYSCNSFSNFESNSEMLKQTNFYSSIKLISFLTLRNIFEYKFSATGKKKSFLNCLLNIDKSESQIRKKKMVFSQGWMCLRRRNLNNYAIYRLQLWIKLKYIPLPQLGWKIFFFDFVFMFFILFFGERNSYAFAINLFQHSWVNIEWRVWMETLCSFKF